MNCSIRRVRRWLLIPCQRSATGSLKTVGGDEDPSWQTYAAAARPARLLSYSTRFAQESVKPHHDVHDVLSSRNHKSHYERCSWTRGVEGGGLSPSLGIGVARVVYRTANDRLGFGRTLVHLCFMILIPGPLARCFDNASASERHCLFVRVLARPVCNLSRIVCGAGRSTFKLDHECFR